MRSPKWMVAYVVVLLLVGATYGALILFGQAVALAFAAAALVAAIVAVVLTIRA